MAPPLKHIAVERQGDVFCVRLCKHQMDEPDILEMADEVVALIDKQGCRKMVLSLGPGELDCLYSVFLAKLVMIRRHLTERGGVLKLCEASPETIGVFEACRLADYFEFVPDKATALAALGV
jgi:anti-anti-sigma factor